MSSVDNLKAAFAGESQANRKYLAFAKKADNEGFKEVAKLFRAAADAETVHAHNHLRVLGGVRDTKSNLREAIDGETHEFKEMYPEMISGAEKENNKEALMSFTRANAAEKVHAQLYSKALESVQQGKDLPKKAIFVCQVCGHTVYDGAPEECPVCKAKKGAFNKIE